MKYLLYKIAILILKIIYFFLKLFPTKNKITLISRQSNEISIDFSLIKKEILKHKKYKVVALCKKLEGKEKASLKNMFLYFFHMIRQMYHIATSKVVILDSYCIAICVLKHKKNLRVIQIWHSIGTMKKFGYDILDQEEGNSSKIAKIMKMHQNYDVILCGGEGYREDLCRGFNCTKDKIRIIALPRVDLLLDKEYIKNIKNKIYNEYPMLMKKKNIVYCPTFRKDEKNMKKYVLDLINKVDYKKYNLIVKLHPLSTIKIDNKKVITAPTFSSAELLTIADYVITDYSCILYEAGILNKPLYFYAFDYEEYNKNRSLNIDYYKELPGVISNNIMDILNDIKNNKYDYLKLNKFINKYINLEGNNTKKIYSLIEEMIKNERKKE